MHSTHLHEPLCVRLVRVEALRLDVRTVRTALCRPFVFFDAAPLETVDQRFDRPFDLTRLPVTSSDSQQRSSSCERIGDL